MIKRISASIILIFFLINTVVFAIDFNYSASIEDKGSKNYKAIRITPQIYNNSSGNLADLALYDKNNVPVPFFINSFTESDIETKNYYEMKILNSFVKDCFFYYDYTLKNVQNNDILATSIEMKTDNEDFVKKVELLGGFDNVNWEKIQDDIIYKVGGNNKLEISFNNEKKYTHYRIKIGNNIEKISFSSITLKYNKTLQQKDYFTSTISPNFTTEERGNTTVVKIMNIKNLKLRSIRLSTESMFKRNVTFAGKASKMLYHLDFQNTNYEDLTIPLNFYKDNSDTSELVIENKDDKPIKILGIEAEYLVDEMIFAGVKSSDYILKFGSSENTIPKSYDISNYKDQILNEGYDVLNVKEIKGEPLKAGPKQHYDYKWIFNIAISVVAVVLGIVLFLKLKK